MPNSTEKDFWDYTDELNDMSTELKNLREEIAHAEVSPLTRELMLESYTQRVIQFCGLHDARDRLDEPEPTKLELVKQLFKR